METGIFIGVDGGGTHCRARIRDAAGRTCGEGRGGPANVRFDPPRVMESILEACRGAARSAGLGEAAIAGAHVGLGLAGATQRDACAALRAQPHPFARFALDTDAYAAWRGAFGGEDGGVFIVGTGSCGFAMIDGHRHYVGGWGFELSDEASGAAIGREALRRMLWARDGRIGATALTEALYAEFDGEAERVVAFAGTARSAALAQFAPLVFQHARAGDPLAASILEKAAGDAARILSRLADLGAARIAVLGGLAEPLRPWLAAPAGTCFADPRGDALEGALAMARETAVPEVAS